MLFLRFLGMAMLFLGFLALLCCGLLRLDSEAAWLAWLKPCLEWINGTEGMQPVQWLREALRWLRDSHEAAAWFSVALSFMGAAIFTGTRSSLDMDEADVPTEAERVALPERRDEPTRAPVVSVPKPVPASEESADAHENEEDAEDDVGLYAPGRVYAPIQPARPPAWMEDEPPQPPCTPDADKAPRAADPPTPDEACPHHTPDAYAGYTPNELPYGVIEPYDLSPRIRSTIPRR